MKRSRDKGTALLHHLVSNGMTYDKGYHDAGPFLRSLFSSAREAEAVVHELYHAHMLALDANTPHDLFRGAGPWNGTGAMRIAAKQAAIDRVRADDAQQHMTKLQYITIGLAILGIVVAMVTCN